MTLKTEIEEAKAEGTQMGAENGALTGALGSKTGPELGWEEPKMFLVMQMTRLGANVKDMPINAKSYERNARNTQRPSKCHTNNANTTKYANATYKTPESNTNL